MNDRDVKEPRGDNIFRELADALRAAGVAVPSLVIDRRRLAHNEKLVAEHAGGRMRVRIVAKSLPCLQLLDHVMSAVGTDRLMVFNEAFSRHLAERRPRVHLLQGKPMPVAAAAHFYRELRAGEFDPARQVEWLVDTPRRVAEYAALARSLGKPMRINVEIDIGLHRGGVEDEATLKGMLETIRSEPLLRWSGLMGYDVHLSRIPRLFGARARAAAHAERRYEAMYRSGCAIMGEPQAQQPLTLNTAGSPTFRLHHGSGIPNEIALGSAFLKPSDFDLPELAEFRPAAYIAAPVLKDLGDFRLPHGLQLLERALRLGPRRRLCAIAGGSWMANPVFPADMAPSRVYGRSTNQQVLSKAPGCNLQPGDWVFFRPWQSEAVLLQFGDVLVLEDGKIVDRWPVFPAAA